MMITNLHPNGNSIKGSQADKLTKDEAHKQRDRYMFTSTLTYG